MQYYNSELYIWRLKWRAISTCLIGIFSILAFLRVPKTLFFWPSVLCRAHIMITWYWFLLEICATAIVTPDSTFSHWNVHSAPAKKQPTCFVFWSWSLSLKFHLLLPFLFFQQKERFNEWRPFIQQHSFLLETAQHLKLQAQTGVKRIVASNGLWKLLFPLCSKKFYEFHTVLSQRDFPE